ncbi:39S ribosomal protein L39, mitochondrial [Heptranchias perlo]|uniref:39S ribosomal protein L39, mitochondrial n=1 Tax=Heptranchias perlo TaxID=212740 RepID=UPI00355A643B
MAARCVRRVLGPSGRFLSTSADLHPASTERLQKRSYLFDKEKERQRDLVPRIEKIEVKVVGKSNPGTVFIMNKGLSTPYNCAMHISEWCLKRSILALVDGEIWDMYKPLNKSCDIQFLTFKDENPEEVNKAYWRSCAMMMGYVLESAFKDEYNIQLLRAPEVPVISGAFCYDVVLDGRLDDWTPSVENLHSLTKEAHRLIHKDLPFESLEVAPKVAMEMFQENKHKLAAIEEQASLHPNKLVKLYRCGDFVDVNDGPHISRTSICSQYEITAAHNLNTTTQSGLVRRFQGISLPLHLKTLFSVWGRLRQRSQKLVTEGKAHTETVEATAP